MTAARSALLLAMLATPALAQDDIDVPSGQPLEVEQVILEEETGIARFRFLAPEIGSDGEGRTYSDVQDDFSYLCETYALPALSEHGWDPGEVYVSLADREVPFGESDPEATQFFEIYRIEDGSCVWEGF